MSADLAGAGWVGPNWSTFKCPDCGEVTAVYGAPGGVFEGPRCKSCRAKKPQHTRPSQAEPGGGE